MANGAVTTLYSTEVVDAASPTDASQTTEAGSLQTGSYAAHYKNPIFEVVMGGVVVGGFLLA